MPARGRPRGAALAGTCLAASVAYLTYSRSAVAGVVIAAVAVVAMSPHRWLVAVHIAAAAAGALAVILAIRSEPAIARGPGAQAARPWPSWRSSRWPAACSSPGPPRVRGSSGSAFHRRGRASRSRSASSRCCSAPSRWDRRSPNRAWRSFEEPTPSLTGDPAQRFATLGGTRRALWGAALSAFRRDPLKGTGAGTFEFVWDRDSRRSYFVRDAHSLYIESLGELGLPGRAPRASRRWARSWPAPSAPGSQRPTRSAAAPRPDAARHCWCSASQRAWIGYGSRQPSPRWRLQRAASPRARGRRPHRDARSSGARHSPSVRCSPLPSSCPCSVPRPRSARASTQPSVGTSSERWSTRPTPYGSRHGRRAATSSVRSCSSALGWLRAPPPMRDARSSASRPTGEHWLVLARIEAERGNVRGAVAAARRAAALNPQAPLFRSQE